MTSDEIILKIEQEKTRQAEIALKAQELVEIRNKEIRASEEREDREAREDERLDEERAIQEKIRLRQEAEQTRLRVRQEKREDREALDLFLRNHPELPFLAFLLLMGLLAGIGISVNNYINPFPNQIETKENK